MSNVKYGDYVQLDDRFETVHIWSKGLEQEINGRFSGNFIPVKISKEKYDKEMKHLWNKEYKPKEFSFQDMRDEEEIKQDGNMGCLMFSIMPVGLFLLFLIVFIIQLIKHGAR